MVELSATLVVGLNDLEGLLQPKRFYDSMIFKPGWSSLFSITKGCTTELQAEISILQTKISISNEPAV